jgi:hypothetical protein
MIIIYAMIFTACFLLPVVFAKDKISSIMWLISGLIGLILFLNNMEF